MKLAFCLYKYFPYSGLSRDFMRILLECHKRGHSVHVFASEWQGEKPSGIKLTVLPVYRWMNHTQNAGFHRKLKVKLKKESFDAVVGFNKMPDLDIYYGADYCYLGRAVPRYSSLYRLTPRYHHFFNFERAVFGLDDNTHILSLSEKEKSVYQQFYLTPENRFHLLPPTLDRNRRIQGDADRIREQIRGQFKIAEHERLLLFIGSGFKTKGLDRAINALAALPDELRRISSLFVIGQDNDKSFKFLARKQGVKNQVRFLGGRDDIPSLLCGGDLLIHPAYSENTGTVLLEALSAGLPVLTTDVCGYADHIENANAGMVLKSPFRQEKLNACLNSMLVSQRRQKWRRNGKIYGENPELYSMPENAVKFLENWVQQRFANRQALTKESPTDGSLFLREDLRESLKPDCGFEDIMEIKGELFRKAPGRRTLRFEAGGKRYFLKAHTGVGWHEILKNLIYFRLPVIGATNEWHGVHSLRRLGIDTLNIAGFGTTGRNPARQRSFIITDELEANCSLEDFCAEWRTHPPSSPKELEFKRWLIKTVAEIARTIHQAGANHRDFYLCHFMLDVKGNTSSPSKENSRIFVIDLHRMQIRRKTPMRWAVKDIAGLYYSSMELGLTERDLLRFISAYREKPIREVLAKESYFWRRVISRAHNLYAAEARKAEKQVARNVRPGTSTLRSENYRA